MDRTWFSLVWVLGLLFGLTAIAPGCGVEAYVSSDGPELRSESGDGVSGVRVVVSVDRAEIETVDRVDVTIEVVRPAGMGIGWSEPDWAASGWERVQRTDEPARVLADGLISERAVVTLEPFLDGDYEVPAVTVEVGERRVSTTPMRVGVVSVLGADDAGDLGEASPAIASSEPGEQRTVLVVAAVVVSLGALILGWRLTGGGRRVAVDANPEPMESLRMVAEGRIEGSEALARVHRAIDRLDVERAGLLRPLAARCERARFGPSGAEDPGMIAREALGLLNAGGGA